MREIDGNRMKLWIGTSGFQYPEWKGKFYPDDLPASRMLIYYAERFSTTEINYSDYKAQLNAKNIREVTNRQVVRLFVVQSSFRIHF